MAGNNTELYAKDYAENSAVFFTDDGILVDLNTSSPVVEFEKTKRKLGIIVKALHLDHSTLFVKCSTPLTPDELLTKGFNLQNPRIILSSNHNKEMQQLILRAVHWLNWDTSHQFCSKCGGKLQQALNITERKCTTCNLSFFPKLSPAIMVLIQRENEVLLGRSAHFKTGIYSALAGFIDMGETAEQAVHREVKEEVGLEISDLEYFGSQSWPFPDSFMIAFKAKYVRGEINIDPNELEDARWFPLNDLPQLPSNPSISRILIDSSVAKI